MNLLKRILNYLKNIFKKKEPSLIDLVPQLKDIDHDELFKEIRPGDIVFGVTQISIDDLKELEVSHRIRPYIVAKKKDNYILAYGGSTNQKDKRKHFLLNKNDYNFSKSGFIYLDRLMKIHKDELICINDHLKINHINEINKLLGYGSCLIDGKHFFQKGNIIKGNNELFYIKSINHNNNKAILHKLIKDENGDIEIDNNNYRLNQKFIEDFLNEKYIVIKNDNYKFKTQEKKKNKSTVRFKEDHYFDYEIGQILSCGLDEYIYLFSCHGKDYGVEYYKEGDEFSNLTVLPYKIYLSKLSIADKSLIEDVVSVVAYAQKDIEWLYDEMFL